MSCLTLLRPAQAILLCGCVWLALLPRAEAATTWFVRPDGGTASQCTGAADAPYPGNGAAQPCAFSNPFYLFTNDPPKTQAAALPTWKIAGGDTVVIKNGDYRMGYKTPDSNGWWNFLGCRGNTRSCYNPPIPAGTAAQPTRIVGEEWQTGCRNRPVLRSGGGVDTALNLFGASNVEVSCLEFTDNAQCRILTRSGEPYPCSSGNDFGYWAIQTNENSKSITLRNLFIHGMAGAGIAGAVGGNVLAENVHLRANGNFGWNFDPGGQRPSAGPLTIRKSIIEWSACVERLPPADPVILACYDQDGANANGDAFGFVDVTGDVTIDQTIVRYNQQDGLDALYIKSARNLTVTNSQFYGNSGQQIKTGGAVNTVIRNNLIVGNCDRQREGVPGVTGPNFNTYLKSYCRASDMSALVFKNDTAVTFENNSIATYAPTTFDIQCVMATEIFNASGRVSLDGSLEPSIRPDGSRRRFPTAYPIQSAAMNSAVSVRTATGAWAAKRVGRQGIDSSCGGLTCQYWYAPGTAELVQDAAEPVLAPTDELRISYTSAPFCDTASMRFRNNVVRGYTRLSNGQQAGAFFFYGFQPSNAIAGAAGRANNLYCGMREPAVSATERFTQTCPGNFFTTEPAFTSETQLESLVFYPPASSPAGDFGTGADAADFDGVARPYGAGPDAGAFELAPVTSVPAVEAEAPGTAVALRWNRVAGAAFYDVERRTPPGTTYESLGRVHATIGVLRAGWDDTAVAEGATYCYRARAGNALGAGPWGADVCRGVRPAAPTGLTATAVSAGRIDLAWTASAGAVSYRIFRDSTPVATSNTPFYSDSGLADAATYTYAVSAVTAAGISSSLSAPVSATTPTRDLTAPTVSITSPAAAATVANTITVSASATDNTAIASVQFLLDGSPLGAPVTAAPYTISWNTTGAANGVHELSAIATDTSSNNASATVVSVTVWNDALRGHWSFDEGAGTVARDASGEGRDAAVAGATWTAGKLQGALSFTGSSYAVTPPIPLNANFSVSAWVYAEGSAQTPYARIAETRYNAGFYLGADATGTRFKFIVRGGSGSRGSCGSAFGCAEGGTLSGGWHHVAGTYDGAEAKLYVDGILVATDTAAAPGPTNYPLYIGRYFGGASNGWRGAIDEPRVYASTLSAAQTLAAASRDDSAPQVAITAPAGGATLSGVVTLSATATDNEGVTSVQFQLDGVNLGAAITAPPFTTSWATTGAANGSHTLTAIARDSSANTTTSAGVTVTVDNAAAAAAAPAGHWKFDEGSGTVALDASPAGRHASLNGTEWTAGKTGFGVNFPAASAYAATPPIPLTGAVTISAWVNPSAPASYGRIAESNYATAYYLGTNSTGSKYKFIVRGGAGSAGGCGLAFGCIEGGAVAAGWHHVAATFDGATARLYVDGELVASDTAAAPAAVSLPFSIGRYSGGASNGWKGAIDEVRVYQVALTAAEIETLVRN